MAEIVLLKECPEYAPILAFWAYMEWYTARTISFDIVLKLYEQRINDAGIPLTWVAVENELPVGMVSLKNGDLWSRKDLDPWLSSLYVIPEYRNNGIGNILINTVIGKCTEGKYKYIYLFSDSENEKNFAYYKKRGWKYLDKAEGNDENPVDIFFFEID